MADRPRSTVCRSSLKKDHCSTGRRENPTHLTRLIYTNLRIHRFTLVTISSTISKPIGSMYAIYGNIYHQYTPNVSIYTIHGSYGKWKNFLETHRFRPSSLVIQLFGPRNLPPEAHFTATPSWVAWLEAQQPLRRTWVTEAWYCFFGMEYLQKKETSFPKLWETSGISTNFPKMDKFVIWMFAKSQIPKMERRKWILPDFWLVDDGDWWMITCTEISLLRQSCIVCGGWNHQHTHLYIIHICKSYVYDHMYIYIWTSGNSILKTKNIIKELHPPGVVCTMNTGMAGSLRAASIPNLVGIPVKERVGIMTSGEFSTDHRCVSL